MIDFQFHLKTQTCKKISTISVYIIVRDRSETKLFVMAIYHYPFYLIFSHPIMQLAFSLFLYQHLWTTPKTLSTATARIIVNSRGFALHHPSSSSIFAL